MEILCLRTSENIYLRYLFLVKVKKIYFIIITISCLNFWDEAWWFLSLRVFGLLPSSLLLFPERFGRYVLRSSSGVCCVNLRWSLMIFIIKDFRTIVFIFIVISTTFRPICPPIVKLGNLHGTSNYILYWIHRGRLFWFR